MMKAHRQRSRTKTLNVHSVSALLNSRLPLKSLMVMCVLTLTGCSQSVPSVNVDLPPLPRSSKDARATPWFKTKPSKGEMEAKLLQVRRNELRLARALKDVNARWYPQVRKLYYGRGK